MMYLDNCESSISSTTCIATNRWHSHDGTSSTQCSKFVWVSSLQPPMSTWLSAGGVQVARESAWQVVRTAHAASISPFHHRNTQLFLHSMQRLDDAALSQRLYEHDDGQHAITDPCLRTFAVRS